MKFELEQLHELEKKGIKFCVEISVPWGSQKTIISAEKVPDYIVDRDKFIAGYFGVAVDDYLGWISSEGTPQCGALTVAGKRCRNVVSGGIHMPIDRWRELDGELCAIHGGDSAEEAPF